MVAGGARRSVLREGVGVYIRFVISATVRDLGRPDTNGRSVRCCCCIKSSLIGVAASFRQWTRQPLLACVGVRMRVTIFSMLPSETAGTPPCGGRWRRGLMSSSSQRIQLSYSLSRLAVVGRRIRSMAFSRWSVLGGTLWGRTGIGSYSCDTVPSAAIVLIVGRCRRRTRRWMTRGETGRLGARPGWSSVSTQARGQGVGLEVALDEWYRRARVCSVLRVGFCRRWTISPSSSSVTYKQ